MPVDGRPAPSGEPRPRAQGQTTAPAIGSVAEPKLTEGEILAMLAAKRRAARLQSLRRISALGRSATAPSTPAQPHPGLQFALSGSRPEPEAPVITCLVAAENAAQAFYGDRPSRVSPEGWLARTPLSVQPLHLAPLSHGDGRRTLASWTDALRRQPWDLVRDRALLLVELAALAALVFVLLQYGRSQR
jgi:hypothetical protein